MAPKHSDTTGFAQRLADVFGSLQHDAENNSASAATWQPSEEQVFRAGSTAESSDEDEAIDAELELPEDLLHMSDAPGAEPFRPTGAFCRALDREEEYDEVDHVATGRDELDDRPETTTEVLPGNAYEQASKKHIAAAAGEPPDGGDAATVPPSFIGRGEPPIRQSDAAPEERCSTGDRKRVRFATYVPPQRRSSSEGRQPGSQAGGGLKPSLKPALAPTAVTGRQSTSSVPEHVRRPNAFDCYVLEEPLVVGGGDRSANGRPQSQVTIEEMAVEPLGLEERAETRFGSGIEFRPKSRTAGGQPQQSSQPLSHPEAAGNKAPGPSFMQEDAAGEDAGDEAPMIMEVSLPAAAVKPTRQRKFRKAAASLQDD